MTESDKIINDLNFCVIDLETTGGNAQKDRIIEIGMVKIKNREIHSTKSFLVNPKIPIPEFIQKLTNIKQDDVADSPVIETIIEEVIDFIGDDIIVAHNISFDVPFLNGVLKRLKKEKLQNKVICTNVMTKYLIPEILNSNLNYMSKLFEIEHSKAHRAEDDARATAKLLIKYLDIFSSKGLKKINQLYYPRNKFELDRIHLNKQETSSQEVKTLLDTFNFSVTLTIKGKRGLILAVIPLENPKDESYFAKEILDELEWEIITVRMLHPYLDGLFQFNNHYSKYPQEIAKKILGYLQEKIGTSESEQMLNKLDFIISHHLVSEQIISYNFLNLNTNMRSLFKVPAQKKKFYQFLIGQINRFENQQKGRRKNTLHQEVAPLIESYLEKNRSSGDYLFLDRKMIKSNRESTLNLIERFAQDSQMKIHFPRTHL
ncbi:MAG: hypothetical protein CME65_02030 [Halobacteriovoraceae bacterium]|nr:hypothetical protein [Halobacteriovoraceae bacterium]|tara:strand:+ start:23513 stop:24805 length:1293 start_codon:yes stop_codon:yes gene_type:complete